MAMALSESRSSTEGWYNNRKSAKALTERQKKVAQTLRRQRPPVYPGTRICKDRGQQVAWFDQVLLVGKSINVPERVWQQFCDVAGVPD